MGIFNYLRKQIGESSRPPCLSRPPRHSRRAFTIVELLVVVSIIGILLGIVTTAATGSIRNGRTRRAEAMRRALEQAVSAYYAQKGEWPFDSGSIDGNKPVYTFSPAQTDVIFQKIVKESSGDNATLSLIDASALFVADAGNLKNNRQGCFDNHHSSNCRDTYCGDAHCITGVDFATATKKNSGKKGSRTIPISSMAFGFQGKRYGKFCRFWITYNSQTDSVSVSRKHPEKTYPPDWD